MATAAERKLTEIRKHIRQAREAEDGIKAGAPSRSTGSRLVLKAHSDALAKVEEIANRKPSPKRRARA